MTVAAAGSSRYDLVLTAGRVLDPESGLDAVRHVGIRGGTIAAVSDAPLDGPTLDVSGLVVAPGFIDLHSHCHDIAGQRLQVLDGVTTALELEAGAHPVDAAYARAEREGRPVNFGFSASWAAARMQVLADVPTVGSLSDLLPFLAGPAWQREASPDEVRRVVDVLDRDLTDGALGIGVLLGYAPGTDTAEYVEVAALAARHGRPTFTHARELVEHDPATRVDGAEEIVRVAGETGAHMHYCHVNSTSVRHIDRVQRLVARAAAEGARVTTESYPYGAGMTAIGSTFLDPAALHRRGLTPHAIQHLATGRRMADAAELRRVRAADPGALAFVHVLDEADPAEFALVHRALTFEGAAIASDAIAPLRPVTVDPLRWPLPPEVLTHPRTAGTFGRTLRLLVRELGAFSLMEAVRRCTLVPARILAAVPAMAGKGRLRPGADADVVVFDPQTVSDRSTYAEPTRPSTGFRHVLVAGRAVVRNGQLDVDALPGRPVRA